MSSFTNLQSKLERAIAALLCEQGDCGDIEDILPFEEIAIREYPVTTIEAGVARHDPQQSGIFIVPVQITIKGSVANSSDEPNPKAVRTAFDARVAATADTLFQTDNQETLQKTAALLTAAGRALAVDPTNGADPDAVKSAAQNADLADFTVMGWVIRGFGRGEVSDPGASWERVIMGEAVCCCANVD